MLRQAKSVICLIDDFNFSYVPAIVKAQKKALELKLPMSVLHILKDTDSENIKRLSSLGHIENELKAFNLPLIVMLGEKEKMLESLLVHIGDSYIFYQSDKADGKLVIHPYGWPSKVIETKDLIEKGLAC